VLEILILVALCRNIGKIAATRGRRKWPFQLLVVGLWFSGEIAGGMVGNIISLIRAPDLEPSMIIVYPVAVAGAAAGAFVAFLIAKALPPVVVELTAADPSPTWQPTPGAYTDSPPRQGKGDGIQLDPSSGAPDRGEYFSA
jgi:hypothetical protein